MGLDEDVNYIVSGLERSGTSMLMQILEAGEIPTSFDDSRKSDSNNPKGYYELEGGKIINKLMDGSLPLDEFKGRFIKVTAFGIRYLPPGKYKIIYSERNIEEILDSMERMIGKKDENRRETRITFVKLNRMVKQQIEGRDDMDALFVNYNAVISNPKSNIRRIADFLGASDDMIEKMISAVDKKLYRQRRT